MSRITFLVDSGASLRCLPATTANGAHGAEALLLAANGSNIATYGRKIMHLALGPRRDFRWEFSIADVTMPILGIDFLSYSGLGIDLKQMQIQDPSTTLPRTRREPK